MLKQRLLTALILIPFFVAAVIWLPAVPFCLMTALIVLGCAWEWTTLMDLKRFSARICYVLAMVAALMFGLLLWILPVLLVAALWWIFAIFLIFMYPRGRVAWGNTAFIRGLMGFLVLVPCWLAINIIRNAQEGVYTLLFLFVLIWGADSGAYFIGKKWGRHKLLPHVSPGKSWEGLMGALLTCFIIAMVSFHFSLLPHAIWPWGFMLAMITVLFSAVGDLFESMVKRNANVKDSGRLLPGHGGLLDRLDSLTAAAPIFALGVILLRGKF